jgi:molybdate transport system substrate-binding protein
VTRLLAALVCTLALAVGAAACGDDGAAGGDRARLTVSAAASLTAALTACSREFEGADVRLSFAGSDELAGQIRQGVRPDVFAAANTTLPRDLASEGLLERPVAFATNELVIAVPSGSSVDSIADLAEPGRTVVLGSRDVPIGSYTRTVLARLPREQSLAIAENVRSEEPDVKGIVGKLTQAGADAGFVYATDVEAAGDRLRAIELPARLRPTVEYGAAVVDGAPEPELARRYLDGLSAGACADALRAAGFGPPRQ